VQLVNSHHLATVSHHQAPEDFAARNAIFHSSQSVNFVKNFAKHPEFCQKSRILPKIPTFASFSLFENKALCQVLPKQFQGF